MKILMVNDNDPDVAVGGGEHYMADLTTALEAQGHEVHWFVFADPTTQSPERPRKHVFKAPWAGRTVSILRHAAYYPAVRSALAECMVCLRPDVIHLHNNYRYPLAVLAAVTRARVVQTVHDYCAMYPTAHCTRERSCAGRSVFTALAHGCVTWKLLATEACLLYGRRFLDRRLVDAFIAPSRDLAVRLERMGYARVHHVSSFRSLPEVEPALAAEVQGVLYVGNLAEHKGVGVLLAAFATITEEMPDAVLWLVGDGPAAADLKRSVVKRGLGKVRFLGQRPPEELARFYRQARVVVIPSLWLENAPLVAIEASIFGRAVIASRVGGLPELVEDGRTGLLFDRGDVDGLAEGLRTVLANPVLARELGAALREQLAELRSPEQHLERLLAVYEWAGR